MDNLDEIIEQIHQSFEARTRAREQALQHARLLTRHSANAIRAIHRDEEQEAQNHLTEARALVEDLTKNLRAYLDIFYAGYTQDAFKEFAEANITYALIKNQTLPTPTDLGLEHVAYLQGLAEAAGELRRRCLDVLRQGQSLEAERLLHHMDDIYAVLVTMDYPDAITGGLRRLTDIVRGVTERTRGDLTLSLQQERLEKRLLSFEARLPDGE
jgi:translin